MSKKLDAYLDKILIADEMNGKQVFGGLLYRTKALFVIARLTQCFGGGFNENELLQEWVGIKNEMVSFLGHITDKDKPRLYVIVDFWNDYCISREKYVAKVGNTECYTKSVWGSINQECDNVMEVLKKYAYDGQAVKPQKTVVDKEVVDYVFGKLYGKYLFSVGFRSDNTRQRKTAKESFYNMFLMKNSDCRFHWKSSKKSWCWLVHLLGADSNQKKEFLWEWFDFDRKYTQSLMGKKCERDGKEVSEVKKWIEEARGN